MVDVRALLIKWKDVIMNAVLFAVVFLLGVLAFCETESWKFSDSVYFVLSTMSTIGYGDLTVSSVPGKLFCTVYAYVCLFVIGYTARTRDSAILEAMQEEVNILSNIINEGQSEKRMTLGSRIYTLNGLTRRFSAATQRVIFAFTLAAFLWLVGALILGLVEEWSLLNSLLFSAVTVTTIGYGDIIPHSQQGHSVLMAFAFMGLFVFTYALSASQKWLEDYLSRRMYGRACGMPLLNACVVAAGLCITALCIFGAVMFVLIEDWSFWKALYFCVVTLTTLGYGDVVPSTLGGRVFSLFFIVFGVPAVLFALGVVATFATFRTTARSEQLLELMDSVAVGDEAGTGLLNNSGSWSDEFGESLMTSAAHASEIDVSTLASSLGGDEYTSVAVEHEEQQEESERGSGIADEDADFYALINNRITQPIHPPGLSRGFQEDRQVAADAAFTVVTHMDDDEFAMYNFDTTNDTQAGALRNMVRDFKRLAALASFLFVLLTVVNLAAEHLSLVDSMYLASATLTTVGFGEIHPRTGVGRFFAAACSIASLISISFALSIVQEAAANRVRNKLIKSRRERDEEEFAFDDNDIWGL